MRTDQSDGGGRPANRLSSRSGARRTQDLLRGGRLARIGGTVVSFAPTAGAVGVMMSVSALAIAALGALSGDARAQSCSASSNNTVFDCTGTGTITSAQSVTNTTNSELVVTIASGVSFAVDSGNALELTSSGGISLTQSGADMITASATDSRAIYAKTRSNGNMTITVLGSVKGGENGIRAVAQSTTASGDITITAASVSAVSSDTISAAGIYVWALGSNSVSISTTGTVAGGFSGIKASAETAGTNAPITINAATVSGVENGIFAIATAASAIDITSTGHVSASHATRAYGIKVEQASLSAVGNIAISAESATGAKRGILVNAIGSTGNISISASGDVTASGMDGFGIEAFVGDPDTTKSVTINAAKVTGGKRGIEADIAGQGSVSIMATGSVMGTSEHGIYATIRNTSVGALSITATSSVNGGETGVWANNNSSGAVSISVAGTTQGGIGIDARAAGGDVTISAAAVTGSATGIKVAATGTGNVSISATGAVTGTGASGIGIDASASGGDVTIIAAAVTGSATGIKAATTGAGNVSISASGEVSAAGTSSGTGIDASASGGDVTITAAAVTGTATGIKVVATGTGSVSILATGAVMGTGSDGIDASASGGDVTITAAAVTGSAAGIKAATTGAGNVSISASDTVTGTGASGIGIDASASGGDVTITAAAVTGSAAAIKAATTGTGYVSISATGAVMGTGASGIGIDASASGGDVTITAAAVTGTDTAIKAAATGAGNVSISASDAVTGTSADGIFVSHNGTGATTIAVTAAVAGGNGANVAAIRTDVSVGRDVTISLGSGASVGTSTSNAIIGDAGNTSVTVNSGATVAGSVNLGAGADTLTVNSGATVAGSVNLGAGADTLTVNSGATVAGSVNLGAGDDTLTLNSGATITGGLDLGAGDDTLLVTTRGSVRGGLSGADTITVESGAQFTVLGSAAATTLEVAGVLDMSDSAAGKFDVTGNFVGGGTIAIDANFTETTTTPVFDSLEIHGNVTGVTVLDVRQFGSGSATGLDRPNRMDLITVRGTVATTAFTFEEIKFDNVDYKLKFDTSNNRTVFYLKRISNECVETFEGSGVFTCSGLRPVDERQALNASGNTDLSVTLHPETPVTVSAQEAFNLTQPGAADIVLVQLAEGQAIRGNTSGIIAQNTSGGSISINVNGSVTGETVDGIRASNDSSGTGIAITAAGVYGAESGIEAIGSGAGSLSVTATGTVVGTADYGIYAKTGLSGTGLTVSAGAVTGGKTGIRAVGSGTGGVSVVAAGAVVGTADYGIYAKTGLSGTGLTVSAGAVTGGKTGIKAMGSGTGSLSVTATGAVVGTADYGIHAMTGSSGTTLTVSAGTVTGGKTGIKALGNGSGAVSVAATGKVTGSGTAGVIVSGGTGTGDMTVSVATVSGAKGIDAQQTGTGDLNIMATGTVTGTGGTGIYGLAGATAGTLTITAAAVTGQGAGIKIVGSGAGDVNATASAGVSATGANAIGIDAMTSGEGGMTITAASVSGVKHGIKIVNSGSGAARVSASGSVTATANDGIGIDSVAEVDAGALTISAGSVMAKQGGIKAVSSGAGDVAINVSGSVHVEGHSSSGGWGVDALASGGGDLSITLGTVTADVIAVKAVSSGAGRVSVTAGHARATRSSGGNATITAVLASGGSTTTGVEVAVGTAHSSGTGIDVTHAGTGELGVTATGAVTGIDMHAIKAVGSNKADVRIRAERLVKSEKMDGINASVSGSGDLTLNVASVTGYNHGIKAENTGTGGVSIDASGTVMATDISTTNSGVGIWASVSGAGALRIAAATVTGDNIGIEAKGEGSGTVSVVSTGSVSGKMAGIKATGGTSAASVAVTAATVTSSSGIGIEALQQGAGALTVTATETVSGTWGIKAVGSGDGAVSVSAAGTVTGSSEHGIEAMGMKAVSVAAAAVAGEKNGILAESKGSGSVSVMASGAVTGKDDYGIHAISNNTGVSVAAATVTGKKGGIRAENKSTGLVSVRASGTVTGEEEHGIEARGKGGGVTVEAATVSGAKNGILAVNDGTGSVRVTASGSVTTSDSGEHGVHAENSASGSAISIETRGAVMATKNGIYADNKGGEVRATSSAAVEGGMHGVKVNAVSGIELSLDGVVGKSKSAVHATNSNSGDVVVALRGAVEGKETGSHGIHAVNQGSQSGAMSIRGESAATVSGTQSGVVASNMGTGQLTIDLKAAVTGKNGHGIHATNSGAGLTIRAGSASGDEHGIFATGAAGDLRIDATGSVSGAGTGADSGSGIRAINSGSGQTRIFVSGSVSGEKVGINAENSYSYASSMAVEVARSASVSGKVDGIRLSNRQEEGAISLMVAGHVEGGSGFGVYAQAGDAPVTVNVTGSVTGTSDSGGGAVRVENGAGRNFAEIAIRSSGRIDAGSGTAILNGDGNAVVRVDGGVINGRIALGGGDDQFIWNGGNLSGITELDGGERAGSDRIRILSHMNAKQTEELLGIKGARNWDELSIEGAATAAFDGSDNADITVSALRIGENATVSFADGATDDRITMRGDLIGERGTLAMDVSFSDRDADRLTLDGGTARGTTVISTVNPSGDLRSVDEGIVLVEVVGAQNVSKSAFELDAASARRGLFANTLTRQSQNGNTVFVIQTSSRLGEFGTVLQMSPALVRGAFKNMPKRPYGGAGAGGAAAAQSSLGGSGSRAPWLRVGGERLNIGATEMREEASSDIFRLQGGMDLMQVEGAGGDWTFGVSAQHTTISGRTTVDGGNGSLDTRAFGIGATASWRGDSLFFFDAAGHVSQSKSDIGTDGNGTLVRDAKMDARAVGATAGRRFYAGSGIYIMPEVEFAYGQVSGGEFTTGIGIGGDLGSSNFLTIGVGGRMELPMRGGSAYLSGSIVEDFSKESNISAGGFDITVAEDPMEVRLGFGGYREVGEGARLMLEGTHVFSVGGDSGKRVSGGLSGGIRWDW